MPYSKSVSSINRVKKLLDQLSESKINLSWPSDNPHMLAYRLREAMTLAEKINYHPYHDLKKKYIIRNKGRRVVAEIREIAGELEALQAALSKVILGNLVSLVEIIGGAIHTKAEEMFFPDAELTEDEIYRLYEWGKAKGYFLVVAEVGITLTRKDPGEAKWEPEQ